MRFFRCTQAVLSFKNNAEKFLSGLTSNTLDTPKNAFLDLHGKIIATFYQLKAGEDHFLIILEDRFWGAVASHIERFVKLSKVSVQKEDFKVFFDLEGESPTEPGDFAVPEKKGKLLVTRRELKSNVEEEEFTLFRVHNEIPLQGIDYNDEFVLNVSETEFMSFTKGCFLGQELVAKVHSRSKPSWKLVVKNYDDCTEEEKKKMTSRVINPKSKKEIGFVFVNNK